MESTALQQAFDTCQNNKAAWLQRKNELAAAENEAGKRMQSHAPYRCMAFFSKNGRIFGEFYTD